MKVKTLVLSLSNKDNKIIVNLKRCINLKKSFIDKNLVNLKLDLDPFFCSKYFDKEFKFLSINHGSIYKEKIFTIKYRTKKSLNKRFKEIVKYSKKNQYEGCKAGKLKKVILSEELKSENAYLMFNIDESQDFIKESLLTLLDRVNSDVKTIYIGTNEQVGNSLIDKYEEKWLNFVMEQLKKQDNLIVEPAMADKYNELSKFTSDNEIDIATVDFRESTAKLLCDQYYDIFNSPSPIVPVQVQEVFFINYGTSYSIYLDRKVGPLALDKDKPTIQINSHFRGSKEQKELLFKIRENKSRYSKFNKKNNF